MRLWGKVFLALLFFAHLSTSMMMRVEENILQSLDEAAGLTPR